jgi:hypothetical protein
MTVRRAAIYAVNTLLGLTIAGIILATWMPAIYISPWFQGNRWVRVHLLGLAPTPATQPARR